MTTKRFLWIASMLLLALPVCAQQFDAKTILDRTVEAFQKAGGVKATFTVRSANGSSSGAIRLKGNKFVLEAEGIKTWFDGHTQWSYVAANDEVNISEPTPEELQTLNPYALLYLYKQGYSLKLASNQDKTSWQVVMTATDRQQDLQCIMLFVNKETWRPIRVSMAQRGGKDAIAILINTYEVGQNYQDSFFVFDKRAYPTAEQIDLR